MELGIWAECHSSFGPDYRGKVIVGIGGWTIPRTNRTSLRENVALRIEGEAKDYWQELSLHADVVGQGQALRGSPVAIEHEFGGQFSVLYLVSSALSLDEAGQEWTARVRTGSFPLLARVGDSTVTVRKGLAADEWLVQVDVELLPGSYSGTLEFDVSLELPRCLGAGRLHAVQPIEFRPVIFLRTPGSRFAVDATKLVDSSRSITVGLEWGDEARVVFPRRSGRFGGVRWHIGGDAGSGFLELRRDEEGGELEELIQVPVRINGDDVDIWLPVVNRDPDQVVRLLED